LKKEPESEPDMFADDEERFCKLREWMVREQLQARDVRDERVLAAMRKVPRHRFVPEDQMPAAYNDNPLPIFLGQTISQPYIVGFMTQLLALHGAEHVLEIGTGSGYQAAILGELALEVHTVEIHPQLAEHAAAKLADLGYDNIHAHCSDGYFGWQAAAPFDRVIVTAAPDHIPEPLLEQLKPTGRLVIPVGQFEQELLVIDKCATSISRRAVIPVRFVRMTGRAIRESMPEK
jgi:protein-L-isoaspartate(D-aspartate) O-methyltransferase